MRASRADFLTKPAAGVGVGGRCGVGCNFYFGAGVCEGVCFRVCVCVSLPHALKRVTTPPSLSLARYLGIRTARK